jgi:hypothetical protein
MSKAFLAVALITTGLTVGVGVGVGVLPTAPIGSLTGVGLVDEGVGVGFGIAIPLSQTNFFPDLMQV